MKLGSIHHVAIIVSDYERSKKFYVEKLGFEIIRENYRAERGDYNSKYSPPSAIRQGPLIPKRAGFAISLSASRARRKRSLG